MRKILVLTLLFAHVALADETVAAPAKPPTVHRVIIGLKAGGFFPQVFTPLSTNFVVGVEAGYLLPVLGDRLALTLSGDYSQPPAKGSSTDPAFDMSTNGGYSWDITQRELGLGLNAIFRLRFFGSHVIPYVAAGPRLELLQTKANGSSNGQSFGQHEEQSTKVGGRFAAGVDFKLGPGTLLVEVQMATSALDHIVTGETNTGALELRLGYRLWL